MPSFDAQGSRVGIRRPTEADCDQFIALMQASERFHEPWVDPPKTAEKYLSYLKTRQAPGDDGFLICEVRTDKIVGVINLNCIVRGAFHSAYLGYYVGAEFARRGYMGEAMRLVTHYAFTRMGLHRLEANIQPQNVASIELVRKCGFRKEGFSPRYLQVMGQWRDHERWALLADDPEGQGR